jgi:hypothetical protein
MFGYVPLHYGYNWGQDERKFLQKVGSVASLLELLDYADHDFIIDALGVDLC